MVSLAAVAALAMAVGLEPIKAPLKSEAIAAFPRESPQPVPLLAMRTVEIRAGNHGHFIVEAEIDNTPITVLIDTGASSVALSYEDAERVGLKPFALDFDLPVSTANGIIKAAAVTLRRVEIENVLVRDVEGMVMPPGALAGTLLGMSFLRRLSGFRIAEGTLYLEQ